MLKRISPGLAAAALLALAAGSAYPASPEPGRPPRSGETAMPAETLFQPVPDNVTVTEAIPPPPPPAQPAKAPAGGGSLVKLNNADIYVVIETLGRIAGINYLVDPRVKGVVNVNTQSLMRKDDALELLFSVLRVNGATAVLEGGIYHIVPMAEAKMEPLPVPAPGAPLDARLPNLPVLRAFPLQFIPASEMTKVVKPFLSTGGEAIEVPRANMLLVVDTAGNMDKHARLVELFDADAFRSAGVKLFPLKFLDPEEMARNLDAIFGALDFSARSAPPAGLNFVPLPRMGALLAVSASPRTLEEVGRWIGELDREATGTARSVHLYRVKNGKVGDVAAVLEKLYPGRTAAVAGKPTEFKPSLGETAPKSPAGVQTATAAPGVQVLASPAAPQPPPQPKAGKKEEEGGDKFDIIVNEPANALIIRGSASEYASILDVLKVVDVYPRQLLLEVMIGEVQLSDTLRLGVDWKYMWNANGASQSLSNASSAGDPTGGIFSGLKYTVDKANRLTGAFRALATDGKVSILSSPSILTANGKKAKIMVADQVPITTASIVANSNPPVTTTTVEYKDVGVILTFTPFINDQGTVTLEIEQEVSDISKGTVTGSNNPLFFKRNVQTTLIASEDRSIVLGGLVKEKRSRDRDGIPWFHKLPGLGWLFGARTDETSRTELMIFITPRVVASSEDGSRLSGEFEERVQELKSRMGEAKGINRAQSGKGPGKQVAP